MFLILETRLRGLNFQSIDGSIDAGLASSQRSIYVGHIIRIPPYLRGTFEQCLGDAIKRSILLEDEGLGHQASCCMDPHWNFASRIVPIHFQPQHSSSLCPGRAMHRILTTCLYWTLYFEARAPLPHKNYNAVLGVPKMHY